MGGVEPATLAAKSEPRVNAKVRSLEQSEGPFLAPSGKCSASGAIVRAYDRDGAREHDRFFGKAGQGLAIPRHGRQA